MRLYATEQPDTPYEIRISPGTDATFKLYEDGNVTYNYEKGQYATCDLIRDDAARTLAVGSRKCSFPGRVTKRTLTVVLALSARNAECKIGSFDVKSSNDAGESVQIIV